VSYIESNLIPGERVLYKTGFHWIVAFWPALFGCIIAIPGVVMVLTSLFAIGDKSGVAGTMAGMGFGFLIVGAALVLVGYLQKVSTEMAVTNKRIIIKAGLLSRRTFELLLSKVESIGVEEGVLGRMLGYGSVVVRGTGGTPEPFTKIAHPLEFRRQVQQQVENREQKVERREEPVAV
jgi:uncharacterized membrane protein YdbT with pleckstrin-like domain